MVLVLEEIGDAQRCAHFLCIPNLFQHQNHTVINFIINI